MQIYGAPGVQLAFFYLFFYYYYFLFFFHVPSGASNLYFSHSNFFIFSPFPGHQMFIFWPVENCTSWNLRYLMLRDAGWALRHWRSCFFYWGGGGFYHLFIHITPSRECSLLTLNLPFKVILRRFEVVSWCLEWECCTFQNIDENSFKSTNTMQCIPEKRKPEIAGVFSPVKWNHL